MKFITAASSYVLFSLLRHTDAQVKIYEPPAECQPDVLEFSTDIGMKVEHVGNIPSSTTAAWSYNMMVQEGFDKHVFFLDQKFGKIYSYNSEMANGGTISKVWDMDKDDIPSGLTMDFSPSIPEATFRVHSMAQGKESNELYVVFHSTTLPTGWSEPDAPLPPPGAYPGYACNANGLVPEFVRDVYRVGPLPSCFDSEFTSKSIYDVFYKYELKDGGLINPVPFFVIETQNFGHLGGGIASTGDGSFLWSVGDCLPYGLIGMYAIQLDDETCGKILHIDADTPGSFRVVAKGVRNSQQMKIFKPEKEIKRETKKETKKKTKKRYWWQER